MIRPLFRSEPSNPRTLEPQKGFTLIEIAIVLGVFAVIMAAIWLVVSVVYENVRQYQANRELQSTVQNIRQLSQRINGFTSSAGTDITATLDTQNAFPVEMRVNESVGNGNLNNPWSTAGSSVNVLVRSATSFGIKFSNLPKKACIQAVTKLSSGELQGLSGISVNGGATLTNLPLTVISAAAACTNAASTNSIEWQFELRG